MISSLDALEIVGYLCIMCIIFGVLPKRWKPIPESRGSCLQVDIRPCRCHVSNIIPIAHKQGGEFNVLNVHCATPKTSVFLPMRGSQSTVPLDFSAKSAIVFQVGSCRFEISFCFPFTS